MVLIKIERTITMLIKDIKINTNAQVVSISMQTCELQKIECA